MSHEAPVELNKMGFDLKEVILRCYAGDDDANG